MKWAQRERRDRERAERDRLRAVGLEIPEGSRERKARLQREKRVQFDGGIAELQRASYNPMDDRYEALRRSEEVRRGGEGESLFAQMIFPSIFR